ncbi:copper homeostasis protein [Spiroplasma sabaudiense Ar-1343]|uniref:Copper homeostasis protein cutC homolog n=1 Tax=Spiroplasma sabaudiense Ar-1343 TaxID=1276257 RepID=W6AAF8_9MOLU|nr:copper homeostasis protein CutC [Spiroplasma sabaudiense]AHI54042.1 copper homeostasis protein [Spiroplasma sabaudiense Ar-1343]
MILEVIAKDLEDVKRINNSQANRIELCANLEVGGLTPDRELILAVTQISRLPVNVIVRPTARDFVYSEAEFNQMLDDIRFINKTTAKGIVIGVLTKDNEIDYKRMLKIMETVKNKTVTFHKAFDFLNNPVEGALFLDSINVSNILTAGGLGDIVDNLEVINDVNLNTVLKVLAGGGVNIENVGQILNVTDQIHIGTAARSQNNWDSEIDINKINAFKQSKAQV